jgi:two-component system nitrogen regulation response regulator GlnG
VKYALVHAVGDTITPDCLPPGCGEGASGGAPAVAPSGTINVSQYARQLLDAGEEEVYRRVHGEVDRILLPEVLERVGGNQVVASQLLGIARSTLRTRISDMGMIIAKRVLPDSTPKQ